MTELPPLGGKSLLGTRALAMNDRNQIVGYSPAKNGELHAVLWTLKRG